MSLSAKGASASTGVRRIGILEDEPATHHLVLEIDLGTIEVEIRLAVSEDLYALAFHDFIVLGCRLGQVEHIGEPGAAAPFYANAKRDCLRQALVLDDGLDFLSRSF